MPHDIEYEDACVESCDSYREQDDLAVDRREKESFVRNNHIASCQRVAGKDETPVQTWHASYDPNNQQETVNE
jgi:hypothetical protein